MGNTTCKKLPGIWNKQGNEYHSQTDAGFTLLLVNRPYPKPKQPNKYILAIYPNGQREYISGVMGEGRIDYQGKYFKIDVSQSNQIIIS